MATTRTPRSYQPHTLADLPGHGLAALERIQRQLGGPVAAPRTYEEPQADAQPPQIVSSLG